MQSARCGDCGVAAAIKSVKYTLQGQTLINVIHGSRNGKTTVEHSWQTFAPDTFLVSGTKRKNNPEYITCPKCGKTGRLNEYHPSIKTRPDLTYLYVRHEFLPGFWGAEKNRVKRYKRCYF